MIEIFGILGTVFIIIAFTRSEEKQIRILDMIGAILFVIYGFLINSVSTLLLNGILIGVQIYKLIKLNRKEKINEN